MTKLDTYIKQADCPEVQGEWKISEKNRRARFYRLTPVGRKELTRVQEEWARHTRAVGRILGLEGEMSQ